MVLDNILPWEVDASDRIREIALKDKLDMSASKAHIIEDRINHDHKVQKGFLHQILITPPCGVQLGS